MDVVRRDAHASRQVGHELAVVEVPAVAHRRDEGHDGDALHRPETLRAQPGIDAVRLELDAPVLVDVVADAAPEVELHGGLRDDPDVTREVPLQGEVHAALEPEVEPLAVVEVLRGRRRAARPDASWPQQIPAPSPNHATTHSIRAHAIRGTSPQSSCAGLPPALAERPANPGQGIDFTARKSSTGLSACSPAGGLHRFP